MRLKLAEWGLACKEDWITPKSRSFRPDSWPPPRDWPVYESRDGTDVDHWGNPTWRLPGGHRFLNFGDGPDGTGKVEQIDTANADLLRRVMTWRMFGPAALKNSSTLIGEISRIRHLFALCSREGILASDLMRFPNVFEQLPGLLPPSSYETTIAQLHRLYDAREILGFVLVDRNGLKRLAQAQPDFDGVQTPYIPPRIWAYQVNRLKECLDDFMAHKAQVEACFTFCVDRYIANHGSLANAFNAAKKGHTVYNPFNKECLQYRRCSYAGTFAETAERFGIHDLLGRWLGSSSSRGDVRGFSSYLGLVGFAGSAYIANFTLQRKEELNALRMDCLVWEEDEKFGRVPIIRGETTKTDPDSDARWVTSRSVEVGVEALRFITCLQIPLLQGNPSAHLPPAIATNPYLLNVGMEPWGTGVISKYEPRRPLNHFKGYLRNWKNLFDPEQLRITKDDLRIARRLTPNLPENRFAVGKVWPLSWHQFRRTGAVNMFSSRRVSDSTMQWLLKHLTQFMPLYYGRNHRRLRLNDEVESAVITEMYRAMGASLFEAMGERFVSANSPDHKQSMVVNLISLNNMKQFEKYARNGSASFRRNLLGGCMKGGACEYGGYETIAHCTSAGGGKPCTHLLYDREMKPQILEDIIKIDREMEPLPRNSPRYRYLIAERQGMESYLNVIAAS